MHFNGTLQVQAPSLFVSLHTLVSAPRCLLVGPVEWYWLMLMTILGPVVLSCYYTSGHNDSFVTASIRMMLMTPLCVLFLHSLNKFLVQLLLLFCLADLFVEQPLLLLLLRFVRLLLLCHFLVSMYIWKWYYISKVRLFSSFNKSPTVSMSFSPLIIWSLSSSASVLNKICMSSLSR